MNLTKKRVIAIAVLASLTTLLLSSACDGEDNEINGAGGAEGMNPDADVVEILKSLPVFPEAEGHSLADGKYTYSAGASETGNDVWTGFEVREGITVDAVTSFFGKELPEDGWEEEGPPWMDRGEIDGSVSETVIYTFLKGDYRLHIQIPLTQKGKAAATGEVRSVNLILVPKDVQLHGSPVGTPVDSTPPPTREQVTPSDTAEPYVPYEPTPLTPSP